MNYVQGKVIIITGAGSGFGKLVAEKTAGMGGKLILSDINEEALKLAVAGIKSEKGIAEYVVADVSDKAQYE